MLHYVCALAICIVPVYVVLKLLLYDYVFLYYYLLSSFIMFLVCISNECTDVNTLEQSFFSGKSV